MAHASTGEVLFEALVKQEIDCSINNHKSADNITGISHKVFHCAPPLILDEIG